MHLSAHIYSQLYACLTRAAHLLHATEMHAVTNARVCILQSTEKWLLEMNALYYALGYVNAAGLWHVKQARKTLRSLFYRCAALAIIK